MQFTARLATVSIFRGLSQGQGSFRLVHIAVQEVSNPLRHATLHRTAPHHFHPIDDLCEGRVPTDCGTKFHSSILLSLIRMCVGNIQTLNLFEPSGRHSKLVLVSISEQVSKVIASRIAYRIQIFLKIHAQCGRDTAFIP
jgi:hypothetical protein